MNISDRIRELRKNKGVSQEELAEKLGVSRQAISKWESRQSTPDIDKIILLSDYFEVSTDYLIKGIEPLTSMNKKKKNQFLLSFAIAFGLLSGVFSFLANRFRINEILMISIVGAIVGLAVGFVVFSIINDVNKNDGINR
ncbi:MAG: helix-turn-helix transcriptional regulator [Lagierella massiliensis]|nr:helix-turn-helix transcriptional regulator [Lagierella massiliensis]